MEDLASAVVFAAITVPAFLVLKKRPAISAGSVVTAPGLISAPVFGGLTAPLARCIPSTIKQRKHFAKELVAAGNHHLNAVDSFLAKRNLAVLSAILTVVGAFTLGIADDNEFIAIVVGGTTCLVVYAVPRLVLNGKASRRTREIERAIPDALDMFAMSINGGLPLTRAIEQVSLELRDIYPALAEELRIVCRQSGSGSLEQAFESFSRRIDIPEVIAWCATMRQSQKLGGEIADSLREYANRIRIDRYNRAEHAGNTASLKLLLPVVLCLAPPIGILLVGPAVIEIRDFINREKGQTKAAIEQVNESIRAVPDGIR
ncbi:MAG: type II secretion system F family protein [Planctomycetales bacterium]|nr:type II secretion system F family protein [Planctomycetales bacterium]